MKLTTTSSCVTGSSRAAEPACIPQIFALGPKLSKANRREEDADGMYEGRVRHRLETGLFRVRPVDESVAFPEVGFYRQEPEFEDSGSNETAEADLDLHGRTLQSATFRHLRCRRPQQFEQWQLWPACLGLPLD